MLAKPLSPESSISADDFALGAAPQYSSISIERALKILYTDESIFIDTRGKVFYDKKPFIDGDADILFSATALKDGVKPEGPTQERLLSQWKRELGLIYAEEWTHAPQDVLKGPASKHGALLPLLSQWKLIPSVHEADVAVFFYERGQHLSYHFVRDRYWERAVALRAVQGVQTPHESAKLQKLFHGLPLGSTLTLGRNVEDPNERNAILELSLGAEENIQFEGKKGVKLLRERAIKSLPENALILRKTESGAISLSPHPNAGVYVPDERGYYYHLTSREHIEPGTPFYLAGCLRFVLS